MAQAFEPGEGNLADLPPLNGSYAQSTAKQKAGFALATLRQAAVAGRQSQGKPFYSIRAVARHFSLPATTVTRLYGQLKTEGVLGSIWGSKTIIEPVRLDKGIRVKGIIALPVPIGAFSTTSCYRHFVETMQRGLWKERFASQVLFYDESIFDSAAVADLLLECPPDIVVWLMPPRHLCKCLASLKDHGIKSITIKDEMPANGEPGYYLNWQKSLMKALAAWKRMGLTKAVMVNGDRSTRFNGLRALHYCLSEAGFIAEEYHVREAGADGVAQGEITPNCGIVFSSAGSLIQFAQMDPLALWSLSQQGRMLFIHGEVGVPFRSELSRYFQSIRFDWQIIANRVVRDLVMGRYLNAADQQTIFEAKWVTATK